MRVDVERLEEGAAELGLRLERNGREQETLTSRKAQLGEAVVAAEQELKSSVASRAVKESLVRKLDTLVSGLRERLDRTEAALKSRRSELEEVRERRSREAVELAKEESELKHLKESFESAQHGRSRLRPESRVHRPGRRH